MKDLGYHKGYQYAHDSADAYIPQEYLPDRLVGEELYKPGPFGFEKEIAKRLAWWEDKKQRALGEQSTDRQRDQKSE